jgi:hypothetical protein
MKSFRNILIVPNIIAMAFLFSSIENQLLSQGNIADKQTINDSIPTIDDNQIIVDFSSDKGLTSKNEIELELVDGGSQNGYLSLMMSNKVLLSKNGEINTTNVNDILNIKVVKKKNNTELGTLLGVAIGALPGLLLLHESKTREKNYIDILILPAEVAVGTTLAVGGAIAGGIIGNRLSRGITVTYPINASRDLYQRQKAKIINEAFK